MDADPLLENLMGQLGDFGNYQRRQHLLHILSSFLAGIHMLSLTFIAPTPNHRCFIESLDNNSSSYDLGNSSILSSYIPLNKDGDLDSCLKYVYADTNETATCNGNYVFDTSYYKSSRVIEWGLVCGERWKRALLQSVYMFGVLNGAVFLGSLADTFGRKPIFYFSGILQLVFGVASAFVSNYYVYAVLLFFYGAFGSSGSYVTGFVLSMELVGPSKRTLCGTAFSISFAVGVMVVAFWAWLIPNVELLQVVYGLHSLVLIGHWWLVDESIRWLWGQGRVKEAVAIAKKAVEMNGKHLINNYHDGRAATNRVREEEESYGVMDLFRTPNLRCRTLNVAYNWFANSLVYYGLSFNIGTLPGNPFFILFLNGLAEFPGYFIVIVLSDRTGRRSLSSLLLFLGGLSCVVIAFIPRGSIVTAIAMLAKIAVAGSFAIIYNFTAELYPTVIRNSAVGISAMAARTSGMITPQIILLDSIGREIPTIIFGCVAIVAAFLALFLPETLNKEMPQTLEDGENFGRGDTGFRTLSRAISRRRYREAGTRLHR
ncbi:organic cation transporter protein [Folsomia candida]|uniref:Organic cation transporter protein n=1 Tax=Folsomia candida TaxID=158441 RepID=A0A226D9D1_FOLCA|nr:organic cation transporter protein [Folsomia candida]OXA41750.1 Organic cation transporter protein [Folsomia candida]